MLLLKKNNQNGFTIVELVVVMVMIGIVSTGFYMFFNTSINQYLTLQKEGMIFGDLATQSQRVATVLRGATDITQVSDNDISVYAYFSPNDEFVSFIHYYKNATNTKLFADVTPMTANPPDGTLINASKETYTIIDNLYSGAGVTTFIYLDSAGAVMTLPIADLHTIKGLQVTLSSPINSPTANGNETISLQVSLRNRKTNL